MLEKTVEHLEYVSSGKIIEVRGRKVNVNGWEYKMLNSENFTNLASIKNYDNNVITYDKTWQSFEEYLKKNKLKKSDIVNLVKKVNETLSEIENYLISENSLCLELKTIQKNKNSYKFIVIPNYNNDFSYELSKFLIRVLRFVDTDDKDALKLAYNLFIKSSKEGYTINDLLELV